MKATIIHKKYDKYGIPAIFIVSLINAEDGT